MNAPQVSISKSQLVSNGSYSMMSAQHTSVPVAALYEKQIAVISSNQSNHVMYLSVVLRMP